MLIQHYVMVKNDHMIDKFIVIGRMSTYNRNNESAEKGLFISDSVKVRSYE